jgi:hypothetical protein
MSIDQTTAKQKSVPAAARFFAGADAKAGRVFPDEILS